MLSKLRYGSVWSKITIGIFFVLGLLAARYFLTATHISGNIIPIAYGEGISWRVEYNNEGQISRRIDPAGRATLYAYTFSSDRSIRTVTETSPDGSAVTWQYDANGRVENMNDGVSEVAYSYDNRGLLATVDRKGTPQINYKYDDLGRLAEKKIGNFYRIAWTYDFLGRIAKIETPAGDITYNYQTGQNTVIRSLPNGVKTFWKRQPNGELSEITHGFFKNPDDRQYSVLSSFSYNHGPDGRITTISESSGQSKFTRQYAYDTMGRLVRATGPGGSEYGYEYDQEGNRTKATKTGSPEQLCTYDWAGRLTNMDGKPVQYDTCGNLTSVTLDGVARKYAYRPDGRLAKAESGNESAEYRYDGNGQLVVRKSTSGETRFIPDPLSSNGHPLVIDEPGGVRTLVIWEGDTPLALVRNGKVEWLLHDHLGSVRLVTDAQGHVNRSCDYDPFGVPVNAQRASSLTLGFAGLFRDDQTGGYLTMARAYASTLGSFLQPDPQKRIPSIDSESCSFYSYSGNDPVNFIDLNGTERTLAEMRDKQLEIMDKIREQQADMRDKQLEMMDKIRGQQTEMRDRQYEMIQQTQDLLHQYEGFRDGFLYLYPRILVAEGLNIYQYIPLGVGGMPQAIGLLATSPLGEAIMNSYENDIGKVAPNSLAIFKTQKDALKKASEQFQQIEKAIQIVKDIPETAIKYLINTVEIKHYNPKTLQENWMTWNYRGIPQPLHFSYKIEKQAIVKTTTSLDLKEVLKTISDKTIGTLNYAIKNEVKKKVLNSLANNSEGRDIRDVGLYSSPVGGVYLGGSGRMLEGMGELKGVRTDANGNLILVGEEEGSIKLPPLRLDDVVTVFRSVYLNGEGPTVTIDPNPENPQKSPMVIRHSKATEDTYVGWVLYETDRLMKGYGQGVDNITKKGIDSRIPGYANVLETTYFGGGDLQEAQKMGIWERFWIVPAAARRYEGTRKELTLFDVPLKVKTQKMRWVNGKLVDDPTGQSSPGAQAFTSWFTTNYDAIGSEQYLIPPKETGITKPVPVFTELRRIALLTAVAEKLRDQGTPMPFWMNDYDVRKISFEHVTPAMEVTRKRYAGNTIRIARVFGGVELSPESKAVKTYTTSADVAKAPVELRKEVERSVKLAEHLEGVISDVAPSPLTVNRVSDGNKEYKMVSIPGAETQALGPCRLDEVDLAVPIAGGRNIQLARSFNSFFNPKGALGEGWSLDLPRLQELRIPANREGGKVSYSIGYQLLTPLNSIQARFKDVGPVNELGGSRLLVPDSDGLFFGLGNVRPFFLKNMETQVLLLKNGQEWHFTKYGDLIAVKNGPQITIYERGAAGQVSRIVALIGGQLAGEISLGYDGSGKLVKAIGSSYDNKQSKSVEVNYNYDNLGRLSAVASDRGTIGYRYAGSLVTAVTWAGKAGGNQAKVLRSFQYNIHGQMLSEKSDDVTFANTISQSPEGLTVSSQELLKGGKESGNKMVMQYDRYMRPTKAAADGTNTMWVYPAGGGVEMTITTPDKQSVRLIESQDGRSRTMERNGVSWLSAQYNKSGKLSSLSESGRSMLTQEWRQDGQLSRMENPAQGTSFQYDGQGLLSSIILHPAKAGTKLSEWQETKVDRRGRPIEVKDYTGGHILLNYDEWNGLSAIVQQGKNGEGNYGCNIKRDGNGRIDAVNSSWGNTVYNYDNDGNFKKIVTTRGDRSATVNFENGRVLTMTGFDGGRTSFENHNNGALEGMPRVITCPNGLELAHNYDSKNRLSTVNVGKLRRVRLEYDDKGRVVAYAWEPAKS